MRRLWTTNSVKQRDRLAYWVEAVCGTYVLLDCEQPPSDAPFFGHIAVEQFGEIGVSDVRSSAQKVHRTASRIAQATEDKMLFSIQKRTG